MSDADLVPVTITPDPVLWARVIRRERITLVGTVVVVVAIEAVANLFGTLGAIIVAHGTTIVAACYFVAVLRFRRDRLAQTLGDPSRGITVSPAGVEVPLLGLIRWEDIVAVFTVYDGARADRFTRSTGVRGFAERWTHAVGSADHYLTVALRDGPAMRRRAQPRQFRRWVKLWARSGAPDFGAIQVIGDVYYTDEDAARLDRALRAQATRRGLPSSRSANMLDQGEFFRTNSGIAGFDGRTGDK
ncbi:hypothetical protein [Curtobacterium pusillum]|uniref:hypothetical protein n=1 Tax=Curtobacterium pusillum TaxID=69373 RepID=UPI00119EB548|nr:hypothetical protein [Curtobacterium pusillum]